MPRSDGDSRGDLFRGSYTGRPDRRASLRLAAWLAATSALIFGLFFVGEYAQRYMAYLDSRLGHPDARPLTPTEPARNIILNTRSELWRPRRHECADWPESWELWR